MCPRPKILGCCFPWTKCPLAILPLTEPSHPFDLIERSDTRLPTAARFSAAKRWSSMCGPSVHPTEWRQSINLVRGVGEAGQTPHWFIRCRRPTEAAIAADGARSRVGTHWSGTQYPREALFKGRNIQGFSVGDTSVGDTSTLQHSNAFGCRHSNNKQLSKHWQKPCTPVSLKTYSLSIVRPSFWCLNTTLSNNVFQRICPQ